MSEKIIQLNDLKEYNKQLQEAYIKPLEELTKDLPRVENVLVELARGEFTSESQENLFGAYGLVIPLQAELDENKVPEKVNLILDGMAYNNLSIAHNSIFDYYMGGNLSILNPIVAEAGLQFEDTGEPFLLAFVDNLCMLITDLTQSTTHNVELTTLVEKVTKVDKKFLYQGDWNQVSPEAGDYIKNKPFGVEWVCPTDDINDFETEPIEEYGGAYGKVLSWYQDIDQIPFVWLEVDQRDYKYLPLIWVDELNGYAAGNLSKLNVFGCSFEDTGEPFVLGVNSGVIIFASDMTQSTSHRVVLYPLEEVVHQLDEKYLPDGILKQSDMSKYATTEQMNSKFASYSTTEQMNNKFTSYSTTSQVLSLINSAIGDAIGGSY